MTGLHPESGLPSDWVSFPGVSRITFPKDVLGPLIDEEAGRPAAGVPVPSWL